MQRQVIFTATRASAAKLYNMPRYQSIFALLLVVAAGSGAACRTAMPDRQPLYHFPGAEVPPTGGPVLHAQPVMHEIFSLSAVVKRTKNNTDCGA